MTEPPRPRPLKAAPVALLAGGLSGCGEATWLTAPAGPLAGRIATLGWIFGVVTVLVWVITLAFLAYAVTRGRRRRAPAMDEETTRTQARAVVAAATISLLALLSLAVVDFLGLRALHAPAVDDEVLTIDVTGHQWWWELVYEPEDPPERFATANELHIPVGRPVLLRLRSADVIHSFWVPRLQGKRDLIPGYENTLWIQADRPGVYQGSCAEFCGIQHGKMKLLVIAEPPEAFAEWAAAQRAPAAEPVSALAVQGREVLETHRCAFCHTVRGTRARGRVAPDLTHLASRRTIAAGSYPNTRGYLGGWIANPQHLKRGVRMPPNPLEGEDIEALLHYLETLR